MGEQNRFEITAPARRGVTPVAPDRRMAWSEWGPSGGAPVLFSPGAGTSGSLGFAADALERIGARLIAIDRPGLGGSDPSPGRTHLETAADIRALVAALALERPVMVGFSQGAPLALACATAGVVSAVAFVAGTDELAGPDLRPLLPPQALELVELAAADPVAAEAMFRGITATFVKDMVGMSPEVDLAVYLDPTFAAHFAAAVDEGFSQGSESYARDTLLATRPWQFAASSIRAPVHLWYGQHDTSPFHSLDFGASLERRIPGATRTVVEGAGGSLPWTHGAQILESLLESRERSAT